MRLDDVYARNVRERREALGMSQAAFARHVSKDTDLSFTQQTIARIEQGDRRVSVGEGATIASVLGLKVGEMLDFFDGFPVVIDPRDRIEWAIRELEERAREGVRRGVDHETP